MIGSKLAAAVKGLALLSIASTFVSPAFAQSGDDFFLRVGRITMVVGSDAGGGFDQIARLVTRHLPRFLPGNPGFVVQNMPTALGVQASNFLYNTAPRDGSVLLANSNSAISLPIFGSTAAQYDPRKFEWLGSTGKQQAICFTSKTSGIASIADAGKRVVTVGANAVNDHGGVYPKVLNDLMGTQFKVIAGYSTGGRNLAFERGEVEGLCGYAWQSFQAIGVPWFEKKQVNMLMQMGRTRNAELPDVPLASDFFKSPEDREVFDLLSLQQEFGRPFVAPPGTPAPVMAIYRQAFETMVADKVFLDEATTLRIPIEAMTAKEVADLLDKAYAAPKRVLERAISYAVH